MSEWVLPLYDVLMLIWTVSFVAYGPSLPIAEERAARHALELYYLEEAKDLSNVPSNTLLDPSAPFHPIAIHDTPAYFTRARVIP